MKHSKYIVKPGSKVKLKDFDPADHEGISNRTEAKQHLPEDLKRLQDLQDIFYAADTYSLLIIFQALDAAGKDGAIKHVMSGLNPQGCQVASFKSPSSRELDHDYLWRSNIALPERGHIGIFNRSYYEEVLVVRVHPKILDAQRLPEKLKNDSIWERRYREINNFEEYLNDNGTKVLKFFLNLSKGEQKRRFMDRIHKPEKNWKLSPADVKERAFWDDYQAAYEEMLENTSTKHSPWYVIPADHKWFTRTLIADILVKTLESLDLKYPTLDGSRLAALDESRKILEAEQ